MLDGLDVVVTTVARPVPAGERQRLAARARQRGAVLCVLGSWPGADVQLSCTGARWGGVGAGLHGGSGRLGQRQVEVRVLGRGMAPAGRVERLLMPAIPAAVPAAGAPAAPAPAAVGPAAVALAEMDPAAAAALDGSQKAVLVFASGAIPRPVRTRESCWCPTHSTPPSFNAEDIPGNGFILDQGEIGNLQGNNNAIPVFTTNDGRYVAVGNFTVDSTTWSFDWAFIT